MRAKQMAVKRFCDVFLSIITLIILSPFMLIAAVGIKVSSQGPIFYKAKRMGKDMKPFYVYKFRTMHINADKAGSITATNDSRIFPFGNILRKLKIDELPQLLNIIQGTMSIIGPRPESVDIVEQYFSDEQKRTLDMLPGLASPGSVFNYTHSEKYLGEENADRDYVEKLMPVKLAMDLYYVDHFSVGYDIELVFRTIYVIICQLLGKTKFDNPKEYEYISDYLEKENKYTTV